MTKRNAIMISIIFHAALLTFLAVYFAIERTVFVNPEPPLNEPTVITATLDKVKPVEPEKKPIPIREKVAQNESDVEPIPLDAHEETDVAIGPIEEIPETQPTAIGNPAPTSKVAPVYPEGAINRGLSGTVVAILTVGPDGKVINVEIESATPKGVFERATIKALSKWTYAPQLVTNVSTNPNRTIRVEVEYDLKDLEAGR